MSQFLIIAISVELRVTLRTTVCVTEVKWHNHHKLRLWGKADEYFLREQTGERILIAQMNTHRWRACYSYVRV